MTSWAGTQTARFARRTKKRPLYGRRSRSQPSRCGVHRVDKQDAREIQPLARELQGYSGPPVIGEPLVALHNYGVFATARGLLAKAPFLDERRDWILHANVEFPDDSMAGEWHELNGHQFNRPHKFEKVDELRNSRIPAETIGGGGRLFDFGYCMTCHRAQGSQFDHVVLS